MGGGVWDIPAVPQRRLERPALLEADIIRLSSWHPEWRSSGLNGK